MSDIAFTEMIYPTKMMNPPLNLNPPQSDSPRIMKPFDLEEFKRQGYMMIDFLADYYRNIDNYPVLSNLEPGYLRKRLPTSAPSNPESIESILEDVQEHIIPGITHWMSPNYYAYFPSSGSIAGFIGEMLSTGFNVVGFNWLSSPAATELETIVMDWLGQVLNLPKPFLFSSKGSGGGVLLGTTCEAILCTLVAARDKILFQIGRENIGKLVVYGSDQTHSALQKASQIAGIHPKNFRAIKTKRSDSFSLSPDSLLSTIFLDVQNGLIPCFLCATVGTTATTSIDPIKPLCNVAKEYGIWVHIDAAYAGAACICPEFRHCLDGVEDANSFSFNAHKWFLTNLTCCCLWVKDHTALTESLSTYPEFLRNNASDSKDVIDYKDWQITLSRKFNALKLWLVLRSYGVDNLKNFLRSHVQMAKTFEELMSSDKRFEIVVPPKFSLVCFRISPSAITNNGKSKGTKDYYNNGKLRNDENLVNEVNHKLLDSINGSGKAFMTHCEVEGDFVIRCAIGATLTEEHHVIMTWKLVQEHANFLLGEGFVDKEGSNAETE